MQLCLSCRKAVRNQAVNVGERVVEFLELIIAFLELLEPIGCCDQGLLLAVPFVNWQLECSWGPLVAEVVVVFTDPVSAYCFGSFVAV